MYKSILFFCLLLIVGCVTNNQDCCVVGPQAINISFVDSQGVDLLNADHPNAITEQNTDLYYLVDGKKVKQSEAHLTHPKKFFISDEKLSDRYFMRVFTYIDQNQRKSTTYLKFNNGSMDTIKVAYNHFNGSSASVTKVWYNGKVRWDIKGDDNNEENIEHVGLYFVVTRELQAVEP